MKGPCYLIEPVNNTNFYFTLYFPSYDVCYDKCSAEFKALQVNIIIFELMTQMAFLKAHSW